VIANGNDPSVIGRVCAGGEGGTLFSHDVITKSSSSSSSSTTIGNGIDTSRQNGDSSEGDGGIRAQVSESINWMVVVVVVVVEGHY